MAGCDKTLRNAGTVQNLERRFYPDLDGNVGPRADVLAKLQANGIPYALSLP